MSEDREEELIKTRRSKKKKPEKTPKTTEYKKKEKKVEEKTYNGGVQRESTFDDQDNEPDFNRYYMTLSNRYRTAQHLSFIVLVIFLVFMLIFFHENITYSNLMYLIRDLDTTSSVAAGKYADIKYDSKYTTDVVLYKDGIAVVGTNGYKLYSNTGSTEIDSEHDYSKPCLAISDRYALLYDRGSTGYSIYNTLTRVYEGKCESTIEDAVSGDNGNYAILTRSTDSKYLVTVYNSSFKAETKYYKDKYVIDMALSSDGKYISIVSASSEGTDLSCEIMVGEIGTEKSTSYQYAGEMPLWTSYCDDGTLLVLTDKSFRAFGGTGEKWNHIFEGTTPGVFAYEGKYVVITEATNSIGSENMAHIYDTDGNVISEFEVNRKITGVATDGETYAYVVGSGIASRINLETLKMEDESYDLTTEWILAPKGSLMLCGASQTVSFFAEEEQSE